MNRPRFESSDASPRTPRTGLVALAAVLSAAALAACSSPHSAAPQPVDDAGVEVPDAGVCLDCDAGIDGDAGPADVGPADGGPADAGPVVVSLSRLVPSRGGLSGGTIVEIYGAGFYRGFAEGATDAKKSTRLFFGANEVADFTIIDDGTVEAIAPPNPAGAADVTLTNPNGSATCAGCFTYFAPLLFNSFSPTTGPLEGGTEIVVEGASFGSELTVVVGDRPSPKVVVESDTRARALTPPAESPGAADVRVFNRNGVGELKRAFTYYAALRLDAIDPAYGSRAGGATVLLHGDGLAAVQAVRFGATGATFSVRDAQTVELAVPPAAAAGPVDVTVTTDRESKTMRAAFVYYDETVAAPALGGVVPSHGPAVGGGRVQLVGNGLSGFGFSFGTAAAAATGSASAHAVEVVVPPGAANTRVDVVASDATHELRLAQAYRYDLAVTGVAPNSGPTAGGQAVVVHGQGFVAGLEVLFGGVPASGVTLVDAQTLQAVTPPGAGGRVEVAVRDPADPENRGAVAAAYEYVEPLWVGRVEPDTGSVAGGTFVTVMGTGFAPGAVVEIGGSPLKDLRVLDHNTVTGRTPPGPVGEADVVVRIDVAQTTLPSGFTYYDPKNNGGGSSGGPINGTLNVTVLESSYAHNGDPVAGATVMLGSDPTTPFQGRTDRRGQITFSDPQLVKAQQVTAMKTGYLPMTIARQESQNLTLYLPALQSASGTPGGSPGSPASIISGRVTGFKLPRPLRDGESAWAEVWVAPTSLYETAPLGWPTDPSTRDARGERWRIDTDGGLYTIFSSKGRHAVYAVYGIHDDATNTFTPVLMGVRRGVNADPDKPAVAQDVTLTMHLDQTVPVSVLNPLRDPYTPPGYANNKVYAWLQLGGDGIVAISNANSNDPQLSLAHMPRLDGDNFVFMNYINPGGGGSESYCYRRQLGDLSQGVTIGPMLDFVRVTQPAETESFNGTLAWGTPNGPAPDLMEIDFGLYSMLAGYISLWRIILPGADRSVTMPTPLWDAVRARATPSDFYYFSITAVRTPRFDYAYWSYTQLSSDAWNAWTTNYGFMNP